MTEGITSPIFGTHGGYQWLSSECEFRDVIYLCPEIVLAKSLAVISIDGAILVPSEEETKAGWQSLEGIAYSPLIQSLAELPNETHQEWCDQFHEWYIFEERVRTLGELVRDGNIFQDGPRPGKVFTFVTFLGFALHDPLYASLAELFWNQMDYVRPESYIGDGDRFLTFVSRDKSLFESVLEKLKTFQPRQARKPRVPTVLERAGVRRAKSTRDCWK